MNSAYKLAKIIGNKEAVVISKEAEQSIKKDKTKLKKSKSKLNMCINPKLKKIKKKKVLPLNNVEISDMVENNGQLMSLKNKKKLRKHKNSKLKLKQKKKEQRKMIDWNMESVSTDLFENTNNSLNNNEEKYFFLNDVTYCVIGTNCYVFFKENESVCLEGKAMLKCIVGVVEVLGKLFDEASDVESIYAPKCHPRIVISNKSKINQPISKPLLKKHLMKHCKHLATSSVQHLLDQILNDEICCVLELASFNNSYLRFVQSLDQFKQLFSASSTLSFDLHPLSDLEIDFPPYIATIIDQLFNNYMNGDKHVILLCGGKGSGKSTFCRYIANKILNVCDEVLLMDCDLGQTEFQPPGFVGLNIIKKPLIGPSFTHPSKGLIKCFVGDTSPAFDPVHYLGCVKFVFQKYQNKFLHRPLIINTMGWTRDVGVSLLLETIKMMNPTSIIQLDSEFQRDNLPHLTPTFINNLSNQYLIIDKSSESNNLQNFNHFIFLSYANSIKCKSSIRVSAKDFRDLMLMSHFFSAKDSSDSDGWMHLVPLKYAPRMRLLRIKLEDVALHVMHEQIPPALILSATNASVCSFAYISQHKMLDSNLDGHPKLLEKNPICKSLGLGIIRSFDLVKGCMYVSTCEDAKSLSKTNCLLVGGIQLPKQFLLMDKKLIATDVDYVGYTQDGFGVAPLRPKGLVVPRKTSL